VAALAFTGLFTRMDVLVLLQVLRQAEGLVATRIPALVWLVLDMLLVVPLQRVLSFELAVAFVDVALEQLQVLPILGLLRGPGREGGWHAVLLLLAFHVYIYSV
jgi:hypothetical protein